jgi:hypothetical protein
MTERQKQHLGRSEGDDTMLEGRDIRADAAPGTGTEHVCGAIEGGTEASQKALHIEELLEQNREE